MTGDLAHGLPLRGRLPEADDEPPVPAWKVALLWSGLALGYYGVLLLVMALVMESPNPGRRGIPTDLASRPVEGWLQWWGFGCALAGAAMCWPGYRATLGSSRPLFRSAKGGGWIALAIVSYLVGASVVALQVAGSAAPNSDLRDDAAWVVAFVWLLVLVGTVGGLAAWLRERRREEGRVGDGGAVAAGEADDPIG